MNWKNTIIFSLGVATFAFSEITINKATGSFESLYAEWVSDAHNFVVYCDNKKIDAQLVRSYDSFIRVDVVGLNPGNHELKIIAFENGKGVDSISKTIEVFAHDRSGFAFSNNRIPGAYNLDGTLKPDAHVLYITQKTKNTITLDVTTNSKGTTTSCKSFQGILNCLKKGYEKRPINMRLVGNITDADSLEQGDLLVDFGGSENTFLTLEGIGNDATVNGWGIRLKNAQNVEIRNLGIMNVDSKEGDNIGLQQDNQYIWVHHNDFFYGDAGSDADQIKGDGALDCKRSTYVTFSYNHFFDNGKSNLLGLKESSTDGYYITYHHNWYDHSDSRHPRVRYYSTHVYNNYYDGIAKYGIGATLGSSIFAEANYFRNCKYPMLTSLQGSDLYGEGFIKKEDNGTFSKEAGGSIKAFNNYIEGGTFIPYGETSYTLKGTLSPIGDINSKVDFDAYVVKNRNDSMPLSVKSLSGENVHNNFDLNSSIMYPYKALLPKEAKENVIQYAGRLEGGDFKWHFSNEDDDSYAVDMALKDSLKKYVSSLRAIQGEDEFPQIPQIISQSKKLNLNINYQEKSLRFIDENFEKLEVFHLNGQKIKVNYFSNQHKVYCDLSRLKKGFYLLIIKSKGESTKYQISI